MRYSASLDICLGSPTLRFTLVPNERVKILRDAFLKATSDPAFVAEANKKQLEVEPIRGEELEALAKEVINQPPEVIHRLKELLGK